MFILILLYALRVMAVTLAVGVAVAVGVDDAHGFLRNGCHP